MVPQDCRKHFGKSEIKFSKRNLNPAQAQKWASDINSTSSRHAIACQGFLHPIDDTLYFVANDGIHGYEIWAYG